MAANTPPTSAPVTTPAPPPATVAATTTPKPVIGPNPAAQIFVDQVVLNGVVLGGPQSQRILVKGVGYGRGDIVNRDLKLKLAAVQPHDIIFEDESGIQYHKRY